MIRELPTPKVPVVIQSLKATQPVETPPKGQTQDSTYFYYRGIPPDSSGGDWLPEDSWTCIQRLASEVNWRAFFIGGTFWYGEDDWLLAKTPLMTVSEASPGIDHISFDYDQGKKVATVDVGARIGRWIAHPGAVVILKDMGPVNGKWLVNEFERSLFDLTANITLKKPEPKLPEPATQPEKPPDTGTGTGTPVPPISVVTACSQTAAQIDKYLTTIKSPLAGQGNAFVSAGLNHGVSPAFLVGLVGQETSYGARVTRGTNNVTNYGIGAFASVEGCLDTTAKNIADPDGYYFGRHRYSALDVYLADRWTPSKGERWRGYCSGGCNTGVLISTMETLGGNVDDIRCGAPDAPTGPCLTLAQTVKKYAVLG
jgi:hypothetical protein